jgi:two-component system nitrate/nitrite response regulator NarL
VRRQGADRAVGLASVELLLSSPPILIQSDPIFNVAIWYVSLYNPPVAELERSRGPETPAQSLRVLVVQDHPLLAGALAGILETEADLAVCGIARTGADAIALSVREEPAVVLMDFHLPDMGGPTTAALIRSRIASIAIVFHSADDSETALLDAIDAGASAYLTKSATADQIVEAVRRASRGDVLIPVSLLAKAIARQRSVLAKEQDRRQLAAIFTAREMEVLLVMAQGLNTAEMSRHLKIAPHTVEWHVKHVMEKLDVHTKLQAVIAASRRGLIDMGSV